MSDIGILILSYATLMFIWWRIISRLGYKAKSRWVWFGFLSFLPTMGLAMIALTFAPWPLDKEMDKAKAQLDELRRWKGQSKPASSIDDELEAMRRSLGQG